MSTWGKNIKISIFGESHGPAIGVVIDGLVAGVRLDMEQICLQMSRRAPGFDKTSTPRREADMPLIQSGLLDNTTTGAPLCAIIQNTNTRSGDYSQLKRVMRPSHSDYPAMLRYNGFNDVAGGGHFSGRLTAPLVFAGAVCRQILEQKGIVIGAHAANIGGINDSRFDMANVSADQLRQLSQRTAPVIDSQAEIKMREVIEQARKNGDSVGGIIECAAVGLPVGLGHPMFDGVENRIASIVFGIPAVRGIEFGSGFDCAAMTGSQHNDSYYYDNDVIRTRTNNHAGVLGGITTGMPVVFRVAFKPTPSISIEQQTVDVAEHRDTTLSIKGRHDPCIVLRAVPVVESAAAVALLDLMLDKYSI